MTSEREEGKKCTSTNTAATPSALSHEDIAKRAFAIHLQRGGEHGSDLQDWLHAESELRDELKKDRE